MINLQFATGSKWEAIALMLRIMLTRVPDYDRWEQERGHPMLNSPLRATDNSEWRSSADQQQLNLLAVSSR